MFYGSDSRSVDPLLVPLSYYLLDARGSVKSIQATHPPSLPSSLWYYTLNAISLRLASPDIYLYSRYFCSLACIYPLVMAIHSEWLRNPEVPQGARKATLPWDLGPDALRACESEKNKERHYGVTSPLRCD